LCDNGPEYISAVTLAWAVKRGKACTASSALEHALIARFGTLGRVPAPFLLRSDNGLVFTSRSFTALVRGYGLKQEFITPHCPQQNGMVERVIRTLKEQCTHRHRFETLQHASRVIGDWIQFTTTSARTRRCGCKPRRLLLH
jgi:putative transposase